MKIYRTKNRAERLNVRYVQKRDALRIAARGWSVYISTRALLAALELAAVILLTIAAFSYGKRAAFAERGYSAYGGEYLLLMIPALYYAGKRIVKDWAEVIRDHNAEREEKSHE